MLLVFDQAMTLSTIEAVKDLEHDTKFLQSISDLICIILSDLPLNETELVSHTLAIRHESREVFFLKDLWKAGRSQTHQILLNIVNIHVTLAKHVAALVNVTLDEECEDKLV